MVAGSKKPLYNHHLSAVGYIEAISLHVSRLMVSLITCWHNHYS